MEVDIAYGVPEGIIPELKKKYASEKNTDLRVTVANPLTPPYFAWGDPRAKPDAVKFEGKEYWVYHMSQGRKMNWVYDHKE